MSEGEGFELYDHHQMSFSGQFDFGDFHLSADQVISKLAPILTEERKNRIDDVLAGRALGFKVVMENIYDRGNVSAVLRSAESFGFFSCHLIERPDASFKASARVTKGADKWMHIEKFETATESVKVLKSQGYQVFATHLQSAKAIHELDLSQKTAVVLGNEKDGVSDEMVEACDNCVIIPMVGFSQSFNISVAAAISCYHAFEERRRVLGQSGDLSALERKLVKANYYLRSLENPKRILSHL